MADVVQKKKIMIKIVIIVYQQNNIYGIYGKISMK